MTEWLDFEDPYFALEVQGEDEMDPEGLVATAFYMGKDRNTGTEKRGSEYKDIPQRDRPPERGKTLYPTPKPTPSGPPSPKR